MLCIALWVATSAVCHTLDMRALSCLQRAPSLPRPLAFLFRFRFRFLPPWSFSRCWAIRCCSNANSWASVIGIRTLGYSLSVPAMRCNRMNSYSASHTTLPSSKRTGTLGRKACRMQWPRMGLAVHGANCRWPAPHTPCVSTHRPAQAAPSWRRARRGDQCRRQGSGSSFHE